LDLKAIDLFVGLKPQLPSSVALARAARGARSGFTHFTAADIDGSTQQNIYDSIGSNHLSIGGGSA